MNRLLSVTGVADRAHISRLKLELSGVNKGIVARQDEIDLMKKQIRQIVIEANLKRGITATTAPSSLDKEVTHEEAVEPKNIFPVEVWEMIFLKNLTSPNDLKSCARACLLFEKILVPTRKIYLLPDILPFVFPYMDKPSILACRRVSKTWTAHVDSPSMEGHPGLRRFSEFATFSNGRNSLRQEMVRGPIPSYHRAIKIRLMDHRAKAGSENEDHSDNDDGRELIPGILPPGEAAGMSVKRQEKRFWRSLHTFLKTHGKHIWSLHFQVSRRDRCDFYRLDGNDILARDDHNVFLPRDLIRYLPNLRRLHLEGPVSPGEGYPISKWEHRCLQSAPYLKTLRLDRIPLGDVKGSAVESLVYKHCHQLKKLHVRFETWRRILESGLKMEWASLNELLIDGLELDRRLDDFNFDQFRMPQLKKIVLTPADSHMDSKCNFQSVMKLIIGLSSASTHFRVLHLVNLVLPMREVLQAPAILFAPPNLTTLEMVHRSWGSVDYNFLLRFPFLENLIIRGPDDFIRYDHDELYRNWFNRRDTLDMGSEVHQVVDLGRHLRDIYESNIWELLPRLKTLKFQRVRHTRESYEQFMLVKKPPWLL